MDIVSRTAEKVMLPITVSGGIRSVNDIKVILRAGADKVAINTAATNNPSLLEEAAKIFGSQCIVVTIEAKRKENGQYEAYVDYGRQPTGLDVFEWSSRIVDLGVGEIYLSSVDKDGSGEGYEIDLIHEVANRVSIPVIASSGAGEIDHFYKVIKDGNADAVSAASIFHYHYAKPVKSEFMSYDKKQLRMGEQIDSGNIEFLKFGYGGFDDIQMDPKAIYEVKNYLIDKGIKVRKGDFLYAKGNEN